MKQRELGLSGIGVTEIGFGGAALGNLYTPVTDEAARVAIDRAWDRGIRYFDTAPHYGLGLSERRLGTALAGRPREEFVVSTKVGRLLVDNPSRTGSDLAAGGFAVPDDLMRVQDYSRDGVLRSIEDSLRRLDLDRIDIVYVHDAEHHMAQALDEAVPTLLELRGQGVVRAVGAGMNFVAPLQRFLAETDVDTVMVAGRWTLADRSAAALLDLAARRGTAVVAAAPFNSGLLADPFAADARFDYSHAPAERVQFARRAARVCAAHGVELQQVALQFPLRTATVASVMVGMRTAAEVDADVAWALRPVPDAVWAALDALDPPLTP